MLSTTINNQYIYLSYRSLLISIRLKKKKSHRNLNYNNILYVLLSYSGVFLKALNWGETKFAGSASMIYNYIAIFISRY